MSQDNTPKADLSHIAASLRVLLKPGSVAELRALNTRRGTVSGYFGDFDKLANAAASWSGKAEGVYLTLNPVNPDLLARCANTLTLYAKHTTSDGDITRRRWFSIDIDPVRASGISSTDEEHAAALDRAREVREWFRGQGWPDPILGDSGNGGHLCYHVELPNDAGATQLLQRCLQALDLLFSDGTVAVDTGTYNASRIWKVYGTLACKGDDTDDRPHRLARILEPPQRLEPVTREHLEALASIAPQPPHSQPGRSYETDSFDLERWIADHGLDVVIVAPWQGGRKWVLRTCLWNAEHTNRSTYIVQLASGAIAAGCHHNSCRGKGWPELRDVVEPGWRHKGRDRRKAAREGGSDGGSKQQKASAADRAIGYVLESGAELFHHQFEDAFIAFDNDASRREICPLRSKAASELIRWHFYRREGKGLPGEALATARGTLAAQARFKGECRHLSLRVARLGDTIWYDLGNWRAVALTVDGWVIVDRPPILFRHYPHQTPQSEPQSGGSLEPFFGLLNIRDPEMRLLMEVYLVASLLSAIPLPALVVYGERGSAKSFLFKLLRGLLDPSSLATLAPPENLREFVQLAAHHRTVYLDNVSFLPPWLSDALCRLCTGEGFSKRQLYSDDEDVVYSFRGLGGVNGINLVATSSDLLDRAIILKLREIPEEERRKEVEMWGCFEAMRPFVLGAMFDTLVQAMRRYPNVKVPGLPRLADFAQWGMAIAEALGYTGEDFLKAYGVNIAAQNEAALEESLVAQAILGFLEHGQDWKGTATELLEELERRAEELHINMRAKSWPKGANILARRLREVAPNLRRVGVQVNERRVQGVRTWSLICEAGEKSAPIATIATAVFGSARDRHDTGSPPGGLRPPPEASTSPPENAADSFGGGGSGGSGDVFPALSEDASEEDVGEV